ncbi:MAG: lipid A 3-O-deacylase, partial [Rhodospirillaceae bacterium]|nr:lipid A 3-O-deacylase [Rhodospirillaceae bacterium]
AYRFDNRSRLGLAISHYSNASIGDTNPGSSGLHCRAM